MFVSQQAATHRLPSDMDAADAAEAVASEEQLKPRISFPEQEEAEREQTRLEAERAKHKARCAPGGAGDFVAGHVGW